MMAPKLDLIFLRSLITLHLVIVFLGLVGFFLIFFSFFQTFFKFYYLIVVGSELIFLTKCPLTVVENNLRKKVGLNEDKGFFVNRISKQVLGRPLPEKLIQGVLFGYFLYSLVLVFV